VRAFRQQGYVVYPVNPKEIEIEGLPVLQKHTGCPGPAADGERLCAADDASEKFLPDIAQRL